MNIVPFNVFHSVEEGPKVSHIEFSKDIEPAEPLPRYIRFNYLEGVPDYVVEEIEAAAKKKGVEFTVVKTGAMAIKLMEALRALNGVLRGGEIYNDAVIQKDGFFVWNSTKHLGKLRVWHYLKDFPERCPQYKNAKEFIKKHIEYYNFLKKRTREEEYREYKKEVDLRDEQKGLERLNEDYEEGSKNRVAAFNHSELLRSLHSLVPPIVMGPGMFTS